MNKRYGVVLIGCGHIGQEHIEDIYFRDNIRVVAMMTMSVSGSRRKGR